jgi:molybdenum cofactor guanylyltransferase
VSERIADCTGVLVAGGRAVRMGGLAKGLLRLGGEPLAARAVRLFRCAFDAVLVVANDPAPYAGLGAEIVPDLVAGKGAPGGLHAALRAARTGWIFALGADMPFPSEPGIALLAGRRAGADAVLVRWGDRLEPLHALWSRACLPALERLLRAGAPSLRDLARTVNAVVVDEKAWREVDPAGRAFENVNTFEDARRLGLVVPPP